MFSQNISKEDAIAFFRYSIIQPLLDAPKGQIRKIAAELSKQNFNDVIHKKMISFSERQIFRWYKAYRENGFDALKPRTKSSKGTHPSISTNLVNDILLLKKELPSRSSYKIIRMLEIARKVDEGVLHPRTVSRLLKQYGYTRENLSKDTRVYVKHEKEHVNQMWISDVMEGFYLDFNENEKKLCYLIGFEDDCSRLVSHAQFYFDSTLPKLEDCLRKAVTRFGIPDRLYVDNGKIYVSNQFKLICAKLGIKLIFSTPYHPAGKGKKERLWETIQKSFIPEVKHRKVRSLTELNDLFFAWLKTEYHDRKHSSLDMTPMERWNLSIHNGRKLFYKSPLELDEIFLHEDKRRVSNYGIVKFSGNTYEAPGKLVGKMVTIKYDPFDLSVLKIYFNGKYVDAARTINLSKTKHRDVENVVLESKIDTEISKMYFENLKINYAKYLEQQLNEAETASFMVANKNDVKLQCPDDTNRPALKDKKSSIKRDEFYNIICKSIGEEHLSYLEKRRLYDLWKSLKDFDPKILISLLDEIHSKAPDYNTQFIYYVEQIKNLYLQRRNAK